MFGTNLREANRTIATQRETLSQMEVNLRGFRARVEEIEKTNNKIIKENEELKTHVREQTEADLLLVSMKIVEEIKKGIKKEDPNLMSLQQEQQRLRAIGAQYGSMGMQGHGGLAAMRGGRW